MVENWTISLGPSMTNNWCFQNVVLEKTLESPLDCKIKSVNCKGNQPWIFIGRTDAEAPVFWPPDAKNLLTGKDPDAGKDWRQKEKGAAEDEIVDSIPDSMDLGLSKLQETVKDRGAWCAAIHGITKSRTQLSDWTTTATAMKNRPEKIAWKILKKNFDN